MQNETKIPTPPTDTKRVFIADLAHALLEELEGARKAKRLTHHGACDGSSGGPCTCNYSRACELNVQATSLQEELKEARKYSQGLQDKLSMQERNAKSFGIFSAFEHESGCKAPDYSACTCYEISVRERDALQEENARLRRHLQALEMAIVNPSNREVQVVGKRPEDFSAALATSDGEKEEFSALSKDVKPEQIARTKPK
jgi:hypothetical protein